MCERRSDQHHRDPLAVTGSTSGNINGQSFGFDFSGIGMPFVDTTPPVTTPSVAPPNPLRTSTTQRPGAYDVVVRVTVGGALVATGSRSIQITNR